MRSSEAIYAGFAGVYDSLMSDVPYEDWADRIEAWIRTYGVSAPTRPDMPERACVPLSCARGQERTDVDGETGVRSREQEKAGRDPSAEEALLAEERDLVVDLGCGTGTLTGILADRGYDLMGIDLSPEMLMIAQGKNAGREKPIPYICQDMRALDLYCTAGTFLSLCDSINYLTRTADLIRVFRLVNRFLYPEGLFLFDFHTKHYYRDVLGTRLIGETGEEISYLWDNTWSEKRSLNRCELTLFAREDLANRTGGPAAGRRGGSDGREGSRRYVRVEETHLQRGYLLSEMKQYLARSGLRFLAAMDMDTGGRPHARSERILVAAGESGKKR